MDFELTETQALIRDTARKFAREVVAPQARKLDREEIFPKDVYPKLGELGLLGVNIPEAYGGAAAGVVSYALAMIEISAACASTSVGMAVTNMAAELINAYGDEAQKKRHVTRLASGEYAGVIVVWARTSNDGNKGLSCFIVEGGAKGLIVGRAEDKMGLRGSN